MPTISSVVHSDPDILGGTPVFVGTRVPVRTLLDYLAAGDTLEEFLDHFPTVSREQVVAALGFASEDDRFDYKLEHDPRFLRRIAHARENLQAGKRVMLEDLPPEPKAPSRRTRRSE